MESMRITLGKMQNPVRGFLHGSAALASIVALVWLVVSQQGPLSARFALGVYAVSLVAMYTCSSLYHCVPWSARWKSRMRRLDHSAIFLLVAGSYTPFGALVLEGAWRTATLTAIWAAALLGITIKLAERRVRLWLSVTIQTAMGWAVLIPMGEIAARLGGWPVVLIGMGGAVYTVGMIIMLTRRPSPFPRIFGHHELFHVCVIIASAIHFAVIIRYVVPLV